MISEYEAERWRQLSDELNGTAGRILNTGQANTKAEWQAIEGIQAAARSLFGAFGAIMREKEDAGK